MNHRSSKSSGRYPGYDVMRKRDSVSWDDATRAVIDHRLAQRNVARFCSEVEWQTLQALCAAIIPQAAGAADAAGAAAREGGHCDRHEAAGAAGGAAGERGSGLP